MYQNNFAKYFFEMSISVFVRIKALLHFTRLSHTLGFLEGDFFA